MATITSQLIVRLIDQISGPANAASAALRRLISQSNARSGAGLTAIQQQLSTINARAQTAARQATTAVATAAAPAAIGVAAAYRTALEYSRELNKATAIGELTEAQRRDVGRAAREIGASTQHTAAQAMAMQRTLIAAGRTVEQAQGMARPILNSALFGDVDPATAADGVVAITSAYRLQMRTIEEAQQQATRVGDILAKAANESRASFQDIMQGFKYAAPIAHSAGWSMEQLAAAIAHMSNNGLRGDEAGVAIRSMLVRMVKPTQDARQAMAELGLSFDQFFGRMRDFNINNFSRGMANAGHRLNTSQQQMIRRAVEANAAKPEAERQDVAQVLTDATIAALNIPQSRTQDRQKITRAVQRFASSLMEGADPDALFKALTDARVTPAQMTRIFDSRQGARLMTLLGPEYAAIFEQILKRAAGASERGAAQMERDLYGAHKRIQSAIEALILSIAESGVADRIAEVFNNIAASLRSISQTDPGTLRAVGYAIIGLAAAAPVGLTLIGLAAILKTVAAAASLAAAFLAPVAAPILAIGAALAGLAVFAYRNWEGLTSFVSSFASTIASRWPALGGIITSVGTALSSAWEYLSSLTRTISANKEAWTAWGQSIANSVADAFEAVAALPGKIGGAILHTIYELPGKIVRGIASIGPQIAQAVDSALTSIATIPRRLGAALAAEGPAALYNAGSAMMQSFVDGVKAKVDELLAYVRGIPGRIVDAIGSIRLPRIDFGGNGRGDTDETAVEALRPDGSSIPTVPTPADRTRRGDARAPQGAAQEAGAAFGNAAGLGVRSAAGQAQEAGTAIGRIIADAARSAAQARAATSVPIIVPDRSFASPAEQGSDAGAAGLRIGDQVGTAIRAAEGTARDAGRELGAAVPPGIRSSEPAVRDAGQRLGAVIPEGVRASEAQAREAGSAIGRAIAQGARLAAGAAAAQGAGGNAGATQGPARAGGGRVNAGTVYGVGERGRELFVPDQNGTIFGNRGRGTGGAGERAAPSFSFSPTFNITGGGDGDKLARLIRSELESFVEQSLRGLHSDYSVSFPS